MSEAGRAIAALPDNTRCSIVVGSGDLTVGELRAALASTGGRSRDMTTPECAAEFGHSAEWWQDRARAGEVVGAYQAGRGRSKWYIPREGATVFLREYHEARRNKHRHRRPWKGPREEAA